MKKVILFLICLPVMGQLLIAQYQPVPSTNYPALEAVLNAKPAVSSGAGAPTAGCTAIKDLYVDSTAGDLYVCTATNTWTKYQRALSTIVQTNQANSYTGGNLQDFSSAKIKFGVSTVANLPAAVSNQYVVFLVTNGTSGTDCTVGGGSTTALCTSNGSAWVSLGGSGSGGSGTVNSGLGGQLAYYSTSGTAVSGVTMGGDCTFSSPNVSCTKTAGTAFAPSATTDTTNASNISSGTLGAARMPALTGDVTSSAGSTATTLATSGVTAGSYTSANITVDAKGRVTAAANGSGGGSTANFPTASISSTNLHFFANCTVNGAPCVVPKGGGLFDLVSATNDIPVPATGSGTVYVYWSSAGPVLGSPSGVSITGTGGGPLAITSTQGSTGFYTAGLPVPTALIAQCDYAAGAWTSASLKNYQPAAAPAPPIVAAGTGIAIGYNGQTQTASIDTSAASVGTGTANYVPRWNGNAYTLAAGSIQDSGSGGIGLGCAATGNQLTMCGPSGTASLSSTNAGGFSEFDINNSTSAGWAIGVVGGTTSPYMISLSGTAVINARGGGDIQLQGNNTTQVTVVNGGGIVVTPKTVSTLPTCNRAGWMIPVSDATSPTYGGTLTGGGSTYAIALCNGSAWTAH